MRKILIALAFVAATAASFVAAPQAQAQTYPNVSGLVPFSPQCNFMSKAGYLRYRYFVSSGRYITYEEANRIATEQG